MTAWADLLAQAQQLGYPSAVPTADQLERWPCDLSERMADLLAQGWPQSAIEIGSCRAFGDPGELVAGLGSDWPPHLLPLARRGAEALGWDARRDRILLLTAGELRTEHASLNDWLALVQLWLQLAGRARRCQTGAWLAVDTQSWQRLTAALAPAQLRAWTLGNCASAALVAERLHQQRRQQLTTARWTSLVVGAAPLLGWGLGASMQPPQAFLGAALATLVVGGAPSLLLGQAMLRARQLLVSAEEVSGLDRP